MEEADDDDVDEEERKEGVGTCEISGGGGSMNDGVAV